MGRGGRRRYSGGRSGGEENERGMWRRERKGKVEGSEGQEKRFRQIKIYDCIPCYPAPELP